MHHDDTVYLVNVYGENEWPDVLQKELSLSVIAAPDLGNAINASTAAVITEAI
jgi:hypothetical protein